LKRSSSITDRIASLSSLDRSSGGSASSSWARSPYFLANFLYRELVFLMSNVWGRSRSLTCSKVKQTFWAMIFLTPKSSRIDRAKLWAMSSPSGSKSLRISTISFALPLARNLRAIW
jgi:hypothetical protein